jgi:D-3-phosphoglycerate dehydrogenase
MYISKVLFTDLRQADVEEEKKLLEPLKIKIDTTFCKTEEDLIKNGKGAMGFLVAYAKITRRVMENLPDLRVIVRTGIGYDNIDVKAAIELGKYVANARGYCTEEVALHSLSLLLNGVKNVYNFAFWAKNNIWIDDTSKYYIKRLSKLNIGIVGFGVIGRSLAFYVERMCSKINIFDPYFTGQDNYDQKKYTFCNTIDELYTHSDIISINCPLTNETINLISSRIISMSTNKIIINTGRAAVINNKDLLDALNRDNVAFYGTDVFINEFEPYADEIQKSIINHDKVVATPHTGWYSEESERDLKKISIENIIDVFNGKPPRCIITK